MAKKQRTERAVDAAVKEAMGQLCRYLADETLGRRHPTVRFTGLALVFHGREPVRGRPSRRRSQKIGGETMRETTAGLASSSSSAPRQQWSTGRRPRDPPRRMKARRRGFAGKSWVVGSASSRAAVEAGSRRKLPTSGSPVGSSGARSCPRAAPRREALRFRNPRGSRERASATLPVGGAHLLHDAGEPALFSSQPGDVLLEGFAVGAPLGPKGFTAGAPLGPDRLTVGAGFGPNRLR